MKAASRWKRLRGGVWTASVMNWKLPCKNRFMQIQKCVEGKRANMLEVFGRIIFGPNVYSAPAPSFNTYSVLAQSTLHASSQRESCIMKTVKYE